MVDSTVQSRAALCGSDTSSGKQFCQGDIVPAAHDPVQLALQLAGAVHADAQPQRTAAAHHLGQAGEQLSQVKKGQSVRQTGQTSQQKQPAKTGAEQCQGLVALFGFALFFTGFVVGITSPAGSRAEVGGVLRLEPLFFFCVPVDGTENEQKDAQPGRDRQQDKKYDARDAGEIMLFWVHGDPLLTKIKAAFHFIIAERGSFVKG